MPTENESALTKSVHAIDGSRRAAWAKFYEARDEADELLRELGRCEAELCHWQEVAAFVFECLNHLLESLGLDRDALSGVRREILALEQRYPEIISGARGAGHGLFFRLTHPAESGQQRKAK